MVNFHEAAQRVDVEVLHLPGSPDSMTVTTLNSTNGAAENSFAEPFLVGFVPRYAAQCATLNVGVSYCTCSCGCCSKLYALSEGGIPCDS